MFLSPMTAISMQVLSILILTCTIMKRAASSMMEDIYETEIDQRLPRSFKHSELLSVRSNGFKYLSHRDDSGDVIFIANWEIFAAK